MHCNKKERKSMAKEKNGDLVEGRERNTPLRCVVIKRGKSVCTLGMHRKREEEKKTMAKKKGRSSKGENACTLKMHYNKKETNGFNSREKMKVMVTVRERASVEGRQHA